MKEEPLKGKEIIDKYFNLILYDKKDIISAVKWLKEIIRKKDLTLRVDIFTAIDMAFNIENDI